MSDDLFDALITGSSNNEEDLAFVEGLRASLISMAERVARSLSELDDDDAIDYIERFATGYDVIFAVWPEPSALDGCDMIVVRGEHFLRGAIAFGRPEPMAIGAIPFPDISSALAVTYNNPFFSDRGH